MTRYALAAALTLVALLYGSEVALADPAGAAEPRYQRFQQALGLTDDQMQAIREIHVRQRDAMRQVWRALAQAQVDLRQLALNGADDAALQPKLAAIEGLHSQALQLRVSALREMAPLLTEEQRAKLAQMGPWNWHRRPRAEAPQS